MNATYNHTTASITLRPSVALVLGSGAAEWRAPVELDTLKLRLPGGRVKPSTVKTIYDHAMKASGMDQQRCREVERQLRKDIHAFLSTGKPGQRENFPHAFDTCPAITVILL